MIVVFAFLKNPMLFWNMLTGCFFPGVWFRTAALSPGFGRPRSQCSHHHADGLPAGMLWGPSEVDIMYLIYFGNGSRRRCFPEATITMFGACSFFVGGWSSQGFTWAPMFF